MRKKIRELVTLLFVLATILGGGGTSWADVEPDTSSTEPHAAIAPEKGSLTIHKYHYDVEGVDGLPADGTEIEEIGDELSGKEIKGVKFDVYQIGEPMTENAPTVVPGGDGWSYSYSVVDSKNVLTATDGEVTYQYSLGANQNSDSTQTNEYGIVQLEALDRGYYLVVENLGESNPEINNGNDWEAIAITTPAKPFVVAVPMTNPNDEESWITDVHVYPKNQTSDVIKEPSTPSVNVGEDFSWTIAVELPADIEDYQKFVVTDQLDEALTYTSGSVKVYQAEKADGKWVKVADDSTLDTDYYTVTDPTSENENTLTVKLNTDGFSAVKGWEGLIIEFSTTVNGNLAGKEVNIVKNKATVEFTNKEGQDSKKDSDESEVNVGDIIIEKVDKDGEELRGATFQIARTEEEAKKGEFIKITEADEKITGFVYPGDTGYENANDWIVTTGEDGIAKFEGLKTHTTNSSGESTYFSYWLVETKAPDEYNLVGEPIEVSFEDSEKENDKFTYHVTKEVVNSKGFTLPNTGSLGMILLTVSGIILIGLAILMLLPKKRHS